jgi:hypothetical protein
MLPSPVSFRLCQRIKLPIKLGRYPNFLITAVAFPKHCTHKRFTIGRVRANKPLRNSNVAVDILNYLRTLCTMYLCRPVFSYTGALGG